MRSRSHGSATSASAPPSPRRASAALALALASALGGCAEPVAFRDPLDYLSVGVVPRDEAAALARALQDEGYQVRQLVDTEQVAMLDATRPDGASALRVVTRVGVALGLDAPDRRFPTRLRVRGLPEPLSGRDLDADGAIELLVGVVDGTRIAECFAVVRVDDNGQVMEVAVDTRSVQEGACVERAEDVAGDARAELLVVGRYGLRALSVPASVAIPFSGREGRFVPMGPEAARYYAGERRVRLERMADARRSGDVGTITRLAIELGLLRLFEGGGIERAVAAIDEHAEGAHLDALAAGRELLRAILEPPSARASDEETE